MRHVGRTPGRCPAGMLVIFSRLESPGRGSWGRVNHWRETLRMKFARIGDPTPTLTMSRVRVEEKQGREWGFFMGSKKNVSSNALAPDPQIPQIP